MSVTPNVMSENDQGKMHVNQTKSSLYWGEGKLPTSQPWTPKAKLPQLEELITAFCETGVAIAGGAVLASLDAVEYNDIDIFPLSTEKVPIAKSILCKLGYVLSETKDHYLMYTKEDSCCRPVQLILVHTDTLGNVHKLLNRFDISVCQVAVVNGILHSNTVAIRDIKLKLLRVTGTANITNLLSRLTKYSKRGYSQSTGNKVTNF